MSATAMCCHPDGCECVPEDGDALCAFHADVLGWQERTTAVPVAAGHWNGFHVDTYRTNRDAILEAARAEYWQAPDVARAKARAKRVRRAEYVRVYEAARKEAKAARRSAASRAKVAETRRHLSCEDCKGAFAPKSMTGRLPRYCPTCATARQRAITREIKRARRMAAKQAA